MRPTTKSDRHSERMLAVVAREAAAFISREAGTGSLITVVRAESRSRGARVSVFVSIYPVEKARLALAFLERQREHFSDHLKRHTRLRPLPRIDFQLDNQAPA